MYHDNIWLDSEIMYNYPGAKGLKDGISNTLITLDECIKGG